MRALIDYAFGDLDHDGAAAGARVTNPASRRVLEKCGVPVDRRRPLPHPRHQLVGAGRPLPSRPRIVGLAQVLGSRQVRGLVRGVLVLRASASAGVGSEERLKLGD